MIDHSRSGPACRSFALPGTAIRGGGSVGRAVAAAGVALLLLVVAQRPARAQPTTERTPNLAGTWVTSPWNLHFAFAHRFQVVGTEDADVSDLFGDGKVVNYPTFDLALGLPSDLMAGVRYSSNSLVVGNVNEWQPYLKWAPLRGADDGALSVAATLAWNGAAQSVDGELAARTQAGPLYLIGAVRGYSDVFDMPAGADDEALGLAGGIGLRINRYVSLAADASDLVAGPDAPAAWSAGLQIGIPYTPHTLSLQATNVYSGTLEGTATGNSSTTFYGFEFTVPFSGFARWGRIFGGEEDAGGGEGAEGGRDEGRAGAGERGGAELPPADRVVEVAVSDFAYQPETLRVRPGTTVRWVNEDPVAHTVGAEDGSWESPRFGPGESYSHTFREPGRHPYLCTLHPFMKAVVVVVPPEPGGS